MPLDSLGRVLLVVGLAIAGLGLLLVLGARIPFLGQLPGDFSFERGNARFYFPLATGILLSIVLTVVLNVVLRLFNRP